MMMPSVGIVIPAKTEDFSFSVRVYPDEVPNEVTDLTDTLISLSAPLSAWRYTAVEYYRQDMMEEFHDVLKEIVTEIDKKAEAYDLFKSSPNYDESMIEIYNTFAADALDQLSKSDQLSKAEECVRKTVDYVKKADAIHALNPYTWILKGFFEIRQGKEIRRAEDHFKNILEVATKKSKPRYTFAGHVGLGITSYSKGNFSKAIDHFSKAITCNPYCNATLRIAIAACAFKLEQYDRARAATERAISLDPKNSDALVMFALLELISAQKEKRKEGRQSAFEFCILALQLDGTTALALNHIANHYFHVWQVVDDSAAVMNMNRCEVHVQKDDNIHLNINDPIQVNGTFVTRLKEIKHNHNGPKLVLVLQSAIPDDMDVSEIMVEAKAYGQVKNLIQRVIDSCDIPQLKAESYFFLGRLHQAQGDYILALEHYEHAISLNPSLTLALFGMGQLYLSQQKFDKAEAKFQLVAKRHPDDKDTQAYIILIRSFSESEIVNFEKVREVAVGFPFEIDLWLIQGQLRYKKTTEHPVSLRCYEMALSCMEKALLPISADLLSVVSVLHHITGNFHQAYAYSRRALIELGRESGSDEGGEPSDDFCAFKVAENDLFFSWSDVVFVATVTTQDSVCFCAKSSSGSAIDVSAFCQVGDDLLLDDETIVTVSRISGADPSVFYGYCLVPLIDGSEITFKKKVPRGNFNDRTFTFCFNYGRILEEMGRDNAALEVYTSILDLHPSYVDCYLRLGQIAWNKGDVDAACDWLTKVSRIAVDNANVNVSLGDFYSNRSQWAEAKKYYEKSNTLCEQGQDSRSMISLGNMYFASSSSGQKQEEYQKLAYKFYHHVLAKESWNNFAAIGLGMVCAEKKLHEIARDIFSRIRESTGATTSSDNCVNLANIYLIQNRYMDAVHMYQSALRKVTYSPHMADKMASLIDCLSASYMRNKQYGEAVSAIKRSIYLHPTALHSWFNIALAREENAVYTLTRPQRSVEDIEDAMQEFKIASSVFSFISCDQTTLSHIRTSMRCSKSKSGAHKNYCTDNLKKAEVHRQKAIIDAKKDVTVRRQQEEQHKRILDDKLREKTFLLEQEDKLRQEKREKAKEANERVKVMVEKWKIHKKPKDDSSDDDQRGNKKSSSSKRKKAPKNTEIFDSDESDNGNRDEDGDEEQISGGMLTKRKLVEVLSETNGEPSTEKGVDEATSDNEFSSTENIRETSTPEDEGKVVKQRRVVEDDDDEDMLL